MGERGGVSVLFLIITVVLALGTYGLLSAWKKSPAPAVVAQPPFKPAPPAREIPVRGEAEIVLNTPEEILAAKCVICHTVEGISAYRRSRAEWLEIINRMRTYGADITPEQASILADYLSTTVIGKVGYGSPAGE